MAKDVDDLCTSVELMLSARNLADKDFFSKSDPFCVVYELSSATRSGGASANNGFVEIGRTHVIQNSLNPEWQEKIRINYFFEVKQPLRFEVYDVDSKSRNLAHHDFLGVSECLLADIVAATDGSLALPLTGVNKKAQLIIRADELDNGQKENLYFVCHGRGLDKKDFFGKSDPYLEFFRFFSDGSRQLVHRTEVVKRNLNPEWKPFEISVQHLCKGDKDKNFQIVCYDYDFDGGHCSHDLIGSCVTSVKALTSTRQDLTLINEKKQKKKGKRYKGSGVLHFLDVQLRREFSFLEFISAGLQLEFAVAVDFTASNGPIHSRQSLHYVGTDLPNQYEMAICAVLEICEHYNYTRNFEATGFGAKIPPHSEVSHLFPLNYFTYSNDRCVVGVPGVLAAYRKALHETTLYGPTNFSPTIRDYIYKARQFPRDATRYQILLIITDGIITDMEKTKSAIIEASGLPLSIIIVGVGNEDFEKMDELDSDSQLLVQGGRKAKRDIVQFVPFRKFMPTSGFMTTNPAEQSVLQSRLAKEVLAEVPEQITSYMKSYAIAPQAPRQRGGGPFSPPPLKIPDYQGDAAEQSALNGDQNAVTAQLVAMQLTEDMQLQQQPWSSAPPME